MKRLLMFLPLIACLLSGPLSAEETDQFTLPPKELIDIGPIASQTLYEVITRAITGLNSEMKALKAAKPSRYTENALAARRQGTTIADLVYAQCGPGFPRWLRNTKILSQAQAQYREVFPWRNVYWLSFSQSPLSFIGLTPTVRFYDHYFGTDKLGHFFMTGHTYFKLYSFLREHQKTAEEAHNILISFGQLIEQSYLGTLVNGVYSNADLSANYAGWKFYTNLTEAITIGDKRLPPILSLQEDQWVIAPGIDKDKLLKPYLSDNLNEAWNPCRYSFSRQQIRRQVKKRCEDWRALGLSLERVRKKLEEVKTWHGEAYGYWLPPEQAITLAACFEKA